MPAAAWQNARRLLAVRLDNVGDMVMLSPALRAVRQAMPGVHLTLLASAAGSQVAPLLPWVDDVLVHRASWQSLGDPSAFTADTELELTQRLRAGSFDGALIFTSFRQSPYPPAYACLLAGISLRAGQSPEFGGALLTDWVQPLPVETHQAERNLWLVESLGFPAADRRLALQLPPEVDQAASRLLREAGVSPADPFIAVAPGASCQARTYDYRRFAEVSRRLADAAAGPVVVLGTEKEQAAVGELFEAAPGVHSMMGRTSVPEFAAVIARAQGVVCSHSAAMHFAEAFDRPVVALFSGTDLEQQWAPRTAPSRLLRVPTDCAPCHAFQCPYAHQCLDIDPAEVVDAVLRLIRPQVAALAS